MGVEIEGTDQALTILRNFPIKANKVVFDSMREAAKEGAKFLKPKMPNKTFRKAVKYKIKEGKEYTFANVGILRPKKEGDYGTRNGKKIPSPWLRAYWKNFGTLANRDPSHKFAYARKPKSANRNGGIKPAHFFEPAIEGIDQIMMKRFEEVFVKKVKERQLADEKK